MTNEEINEAVARKLGWEYKFAVPDQPMSLGWVRDGCIKAPNPPAYSTFIEAAWEIVSSQKTLEFKISNVGHRPIWRCIIVSYGINLAADVEASTAPLAICKAFLKLP